MGDLGTSRRDPRHLPTEDADLMRERKVKKHKKRKENCWESPKFHISLLVLSFVITVSAVIIIVVAQKMEDSSVHKNGTTTDLACVKCSFLTNKLSTSLSHPMLNALSKKTVGNVDMCCAGSSASMSALIQLIMWTKTSQIELETFYPGNFSFSKASIHKRLLPSNFQPELEVPKFLPNENVPLTFDPNEVDPLTEHVREVELMHSTAVILHPGLYYVYSSVLFKPDSAKPCKDYERQTWDHNIVLTRNNDKNSSCIIFRSVHTCCDECIRHKATSFTGGTLYLQRNDELRVEVSGYSLVSFRKEGSFFGLMMLGSEEN